MRVHKITHKHTCTQTGGNKNQRTGQHIVELVTVKYRCT